VSPAVPLARIDEDGVPVTTYHVRDVAGVHYVIQAPKPAWGGWSAEPASIEYVGCDEGSAHAVAHALAHYWETREVPTEQCYFGRHGGIEVDLTKLRAHHRRLRMAS
jgi:hypothetical protein